MGRWLPVSQPPVWGSPVPRPRLPSWTGPLPPDSSSSQASSAFWTGGPTSLLQSPRVGEGVWSPKGEGLGTRGAVEERPWGPHAKLAGDALGPQHGA